jgi:hypothetical protein
MVRFVVLVDVAQQPSIRTKAARAEYARTQGDAVIDIQHERLISLKAACKLIPGRSGGRVSRATIWRWAMKGRRGIRLETVLLGDRYTSREAIDRFFAKLNDFPAVAHDVNQARDAKRVERVLEAEGF